MSALSVEATHERQVWQQLKGHVECGSVSTMLYEVSAAAYTFMFFLGQSLFDTNLRFGYLVEGFIGTLQTLVLCGLVLSIVVAPKPLSFSRLKMLVALGCGALVVYVSDWYDNFHFICVMCFILAYPRSLDARRIVRIVLVVGVCTSVLIVLSALAGIIDNNIRYEHGTLRYGFGFSYGIVLSRNLSFLLMMWMYLKTSVWRPLHGAICFSLALVIYTIGNGRAAFATVLALMVFIIAWRSPRVSGGLRAFLAALVKFFGTYCFVIMAVVSILAALLLGNYSSDNELLVTLNNMLGGLLTSRVRYWKMGLDTLGVGILGTGQLPAVPFDNTYMRVLVKCGILPLIMLCAVYVAYGRQADSHDDFYTLLFMIAVGVFAIQSPYMYVFANNFTLLLLGERFGLYADATDAGLSLGRANDRR